MKIKENLSKQELVQKIIEKKEFSDLPPLDVEKVLTSFDKPHRTNEEKNNQLRNDLTGYILFDGEGVGSDQSWQPEKSFLILGIGLDDAMLIGKKYRQNAIVVGKIYEEPQLIWIK
jgi:hypothetical protein